MVNRQYFYSLVVVLAVLDVVLVHHGDLALGRILLPLQCELDPEEKEGK